MDTESLRGTIAGLMPGLLEELGFAGGTRCGP